MGSPAWAGTAGCGELKPCQASSPAQGLGARQCQEPVPLPIAWGRHFPQPLVETPPQKHWHEPLIPGRCLERKEKAWGTQGRFSCGGEERKKGERRKEGCPSQLIAAWHLCPRAGIQVRREQARCHHSRWARRQAAPSPQSCHSSGRGTAV